MATSNTLGLPPKFATIPLVSSSLALFYAVVEYTVFEPFLQSAKSDPRTTNRALRLWWSNYLPYGFCTIFSVPLPSAAAGLYALQHLPRESFHFSLYAAGAAFSLGHFLFVPPVAKTILSMCDEEVEKKRKTTDYLRKWLRLHAWRTVLMDTPALVRFAWLVFGS